VFGTGIWVSILYSCGWGCYGDFGCFVVYGSRVMNDASRKVGLERCIDYLSVYADSGELEVYVNRRGFASRHWGSIHR